MIGEIDQDGNGCISFNEFLYLMTKNVHEDGDIEEEIRYQILNGNKSK